MTPVDTSLASLSHAAAASMLGRLKQLHSGSGRSVDESLAASMPELQAISASSKQDAMRRQLALAKTEREAGGVGAERRFDRQLADIDAIDRGWADAVQASLRQQIQEWVNTGEPVLGPAGWIRVTVRPYQRGSVWWTDAARADQWCRTVARDVFTCIAADPRAQTADPLGLAELSEPTIGQAIDFSVMAMLGDFQDQQRYDAARYQVHPLQAQEAAERIHAMRRPLDEACRAELLRLLGEWRASGG